MASFSRFQQFAVVALLVSGCLHLLLWSAGEQAWEGPTSFRKPALFGISTGLTLWSCLWVSYLLSPSPWVNWSKRLLSAALLVEVGLITLQAWRGEASHFNRRSPFDASVETTLLVLITIASAIIFWLNALALRRDQLATVGPPMRLAVQAGLSLLSLSCLLGFVITAIGTQQAAAGLAPETLQPRGVLKFPHGAALHAIQTLVLVAWCASRIGSRWPQAVVWFAIAAHLLGLLFASLQTFLGRSRFELDFLGSTLLTATTLALLISGVLLLYRQPTDARRSAPSLSR